MILTKLLNEAGLFGGQLVPNGTDKMAGSIEADEAITIISRRDRFLEHLLDGPKYNRDLRSELGVSRSTAYKGLRELEEWDLIDRTEDGYVPTLLGRLLFEEYRQFRSNVAKISRPGTLLSFLPVETDIGPDVLDGAEIYFARRHAPNQPVNAIEDAVRGATALKGIGPVVLPSYVRVFHELIVEEDLEAEFLFERRVIEYLVTDYADECAEAFETGALDVLLSDDELPFALLVVERPVRQMGIVAYDRDGELRGFVANDSDRAVEWAHDVWNRYADGTARVTTIADGEYEIESSASE